MSFKQKYIKYKTKYLELKNQYAGAIKNYEYINTSDVKNYQFKFSGDSRLHGLYHLCNKNTIIDYTRDSNIKYKNTPDEIKTTFTDMIKDYINEVEDKIRSFYNKEYIKNNCIHVVNEVNKVIKHYELNTKNMPDKVHQLFDGIADVKQKYNKQEILDFGIFFDRIHKKIKNKGKKMCNKNIDKIFELINTENFKFIHKNYLLLNKNFSGKTLDEWFNSAHNCFVIFGKNIIQMIKNIDPNVDENIIKKTTEYKCYSNSAYLTIKYGETESTMGMPVNLINYLNASYGIEKDLFHDSCDDNAISGGSYNILDFLMLPLSCIIGSLYVTELTFLTAMVHEFGHEFGAGDSAGLKFSDKRITQSVLDNFKLNNLNNTQFVRSNCIKCKTLSDVFKKSHKVNNNIEAVGISQEFLADYFAISFIDKYFQINSNLTDNEKINMLKNSLAWSCIPNTNEVMGGHPQHSIRVNSLLLNENLFNFYIKHYDAFK